MNAIKQCKLTPPITHNLTSNEEGPRSRPASRRPAAAVGALAGGLVSSHIGYRTPSCTSSLSGRCWQASKDSQHIMADGQQNEGTAAAVQVLGYLGAIFFAIVLVPQIALNQKRRCVCHVMSCQGSVCLRCRWRNVTTGTHAHTPLRSTDGLSLHLVLLWHAAALLYLAFIIQRGLPVSLAAQQFIFSGTCPVACTAGWRSTPLFYLIEIFNRKNKRQSLPSSWRCRSWHSDTMRRPNRHHHHHHHWPRPSTAHQRKRRKGT